MSAKLIKIKLVILAIGTLFLFNQCGNPYQSNPSELQFSDQGVVGSSLNTSASVNAFEDSVYQITKTRCASCHATQNPRHAHPDVKLAHDVVINQFKVNFSNIPNSRLVAKIRDENHGCWSNCSDNASQMQAAIDYWANEIKVIEDTNNPIVVDENMNNALDPQVSVNLFETTVYPLLRQRCINCHRTTSPRHAQDDVFAAHTVIHDYNLVNMTNTAASRLVTRLQNDNHHCWSGNCSNSANQMKAVIDQWKNALADAQLPSSNDPLKTAQSLTAIELVAGNVSAEGILSFNLSSNLGVNAPVTLQLKFRIFDDYSYLFYEPRIMASALKIRIKNMKLLINGQYNPQNSAYTVVNLTTNGNTLLATHSLLALKDQGNAIDRFSFAFEILEITD
jgi:hypothetical protein